jgi:hypothetical protein
MAGTGTKEKGDSLLRGDPQEVAKRILTTLKKEKAIDS